jgi:hypothetical protein
MDNKDNITNAPHPLDLLPGYIDNSLPEADLAAVRAHLETCASCRAYQADLQSTLSMLQHMPLVPAPRSFAITPEMAGRVRKRSFWERIFTPTFAPTFAGGSVVAFALLIFLFVTSTTSSVPASPQVTTASSALIADSATPSDQARVAPNADTQPKQNPGSGATTSAGEEPTVQTLGAAPNNSAAPAPATPNPDAITDAQAPSEGTPPEDTPATAYSFRPSAQVPESNTVASGLANEPGMTTYAGNYTATPPSTPASILELGLLALGVALAAAAIIARRRI